MGRLLYDLKAVDERTMQKYRQESQKAGKGSFALAWVMDQSEEERKRLVLTLDRSANYLQGCHDRYRQSNFFHSEQIIPSLGRAGSPGFYPKHDSRCNSGRLWIIGFGCVPGRIRVRLHSAKSNP